MKVFGKEIEGSFTDADFLERLEGIIATHAANYAALKLDQCETVSERIRAECRYFDSIFDSLFGTGTAANLFDGWDLQNRIDAWFDTLDALRDAGARNDERIAQYTKRLRKR